jgi:sugar-specific transcriptional regulator TrmB
MEYDNPMLEKFLEEIGLTDKEAPVYLALLGQDSATPSELAEKTGIKRTTVYVVLESLEKKGLASELPSGTTSRFHAEPPERLQTYIERQRVLLEEKSARLKDIIPQIKSVSRGKGERPIIKFFEGRDGAISANEEFYEMHEKRSKEGYFIFNRDLMESTYSEKERERFVKIRKDKEVVPMSVYNKKSGDYPFKTPGNRIRIDAEKYPILADITVIEDRIIATTMSDDTVSILIKSTDLAVTLASLVRYIHDQNKNQKGGES